VSGVANAAESSVKWDSDSTGSAPSTAEDLVNSVTSTGNQLFLRMNVADAYAQDISDTTGGKLINGTVTPLA
jgi:hypothetical protein